MFLKHLSENELSSPLQELQSAGVVSVAGTKVSYALPTETSSRLIGLTVCEPASPDSSHAPGFVATVSE